MRKSKYIFIILAIVLAMTFIGCGKNDTLSKDKTQSAQTSTDEELNDKELNDKEQNDEELKDEESNKEEIEQKEQEQAQDEKENAQSENAQGNEALQNSGATEDYTEPAFYMTDAAEDLEEAAKYVHYIVSRSDYAMNIMFEANRDVKNVQVYLLEFVDFDNNYTPIFNIKEKTNIQDAPNGEKFTVSIEMGEIVPFYGLYYENPDGSSAVYGIEASGKDGSLYLTEIKINQGAGI